MPSRPSAQACRNMRSPSAASMLLGKDQHRPCPPEKLFQHRSAAEEFHPPQISHAQVQEVEGVEAGRPLAVAPQEAMKVGQALRAVSDRLAVQYEISRQVAQRCRDGDGRDWRFASVRRHYQWRPDDSNSPLSPHWRSLTIQQGQTRESREAVHPRSPGFQVRIKAGSHYGPDARCGTTVGKARRWRPAGFEDQRVLGGRRGGAPGDPWRRRSTPETGGSTESLRSPYLVSLTPARGRRGR
jgi:hypothetical protein